MVRNALIPAPLRVCLRPKGIVASCAPLLRVGALLVLTIKLPHQVGAHCRRNMQHGAPRVLGVSQSAASPFGFARCFTRSVERPPSAFDRSAPRGAQTGRAKVSVPDGGGGHGCAGGGRMGQRPSALAPARFPAHTPEAVFTSPAAILLHGSHTAI